MPGIPCVHSDVRVCVCGAFVLVIILFLYFPLMVVTGPVYLHPRCHPGGSHVWRHSGGVWRSEEDSGPATEAGPVREN